MEKESQLILKSFFEKSIEKNYNNKIIAGKYKTDSNEIYQYILDISSVPICDYLLYINNFCHREEILSSDVYQFSSFDDATINICEKIKVLNNPGLTFKDIGLILQNDGKERTLLANNKYGENHIKTAESLGLAFKDEKSNLYYISAVGLVFPDLNRIARERLLTRLILRNKITTQLILLSNNDRVSLETLLYDLSKSTYVRRRSNIKKVLLELEKSKEYDFNTITKKIIF